MSRCIITEAQFSRNSCEITLRSMWRNFFSTTSNGPSLCRIFAICILTIEANAANPVPNKNLHFAGIFNKFSCHGTSLWSQHRCWRWHRAINWANINPSVCRRVASLGHPKINGHSIFVSQKRFYDSFSCMRHVTWRIYPGVPFINKV